MIVHSEHILVIFFHCRQASGFTLVPPGTPPRQTTTCEFVEQVICLLPPIGQTRPTESKTPGNSSIDPDQPITRHFFRPRTGNPLPSGNVAICITYCIAICNALRQVLMQYNWIYTFAIQRCQRRSMHYLCNAGDCFIENTEISGPGDYGR